jgi:hypothetical protein
MVIEGSSEKEKAGEYVIDVSEYAEVDGNKKVDYYQLKHTTVREQEPFTLSDFKDTIEGFAKRFTQHRQNLAETSPIMSFSIITNRQIADSFKKNLLTIAQGKIAETSFTNTLEKYVNLSPENLRSFCEVLKLEDGQGNYNLQRQELRNEMAQLVAGVIDNMHVNDIVVLIQDKVLPDSDHIITREDVLKRFGITSERDLYPAPAEWEKLENIIERKLHQELKDKIIASSQATIVHAAGGVGKSVFCRQLINSLPDGSIGVAYDCFGAGKYRNRSEPRHGHRHALLQIANELATKGLCDPLLIQETALDEQIVQKFLIRIEAVCQSLKTRIPSAQLFIVVDAADNSEMAAKEFNHSCFAHELLREQMPQGCKLVFLCRTERVNLLQPQSSVLQLELEPFCEQETLQNLRRKFPDTDEKEGLEFHRLTAGNPRVQANALDAEYVSVHELLTSLGPAGTSIEDQIELQLNFAVSKIRDLLPYEFQDQINAICLGLASLPPHIPLEVLSKAAGVSINNVKSFVADIGRSLWLSDRSIQFRDEPTETWFRNKFLANRSDYELYISKLAPFAQDITYVAEVLPQLYLQAEQYQKLIDLALSDEYLPDNNPIDARSVSVYRLQFAFKAALRADNYPDAIKLAMRAGEEVAGNQRQLSLLQDNIDLLTSLQHKEKVQEIAFKKILRGQWSGSENVYAASLLSGIKEFHGEAKGYLRAALNWLHIYFVESKKNKDRYHHDGVNDEDLVELAYAHLNLHGVDRVFNFLSSFTPKEAIFRVVQNLARRLIDLGRFEEIDEFLNVSRRQVYFTVALTSELGKIGKFPSKSTLENGLDFLCHHRTRISQPERFSSDERLMPAILAFTEACLFYEMASEKILRILKYYFPEKASKMVSDSHFPEHRTIFLKVLAIRAMLTGRYELDLTAISPKEFITEKKTHEVDSDVREFREVINGLFPWFLLRAKTIHARNFKLIDEISKVSDESKKARVNRYRNYDSLPSEIADICSSILKIYDQKDPGDIKLLYERYLEQDKGFKLYSKLSLLRAAHRNSHLSSIRNQLEQSIYELAKSIRDDGPEATADRYISLARSVLTTSNVDASVYFDDAINIASKFGDEIVSRWEATSALAERSCTTGKTSNQLAYRFIRCAELVGENVSREKYWDRGEAMRICAKMSPGIGISTLSRLRDRDVIKFDYQLQILLQELVRDKQISPTVGWAVSRMCSSDYLAEQLSISFENEKSDENKKRVLHDAIHLLQVEGCDGAYWLKIKQIADQHKIRNNELENILRFYGESISSKHESVEQTEIIQTTEQSVMWEDIFRNLIITDSADFDLLVKRYVATLDKERYGRPMQDLLAECLQRIKQVSIFDFLHILLMSDAVDRYDLQQFLTIIPSEWKTKVGFKKHWPEFVYKFGETYARDLTNEYSFKSFLDATKADAESITQLKFGVRSGLANGYELTSADTFFGFVRLATDLIEEKESLSLIDFSLSRFELHMESEFADGQWEAWLDVTNDNNRNIAGFIWSALGSPRSAERWNAVHCVRKLADLSCTKVIDALVEWMKHNRVDAFGHKKFSFYNLHAQLYLLISMDRISMLQPCLLRKYAQTFSECALNLQHILIQKFASNIALNIEQTFTGTFKPEIIEALHDIGKSKMPCEEKEYEYSTDTYWHSIGEVDTGVDFHFGWDFDRYWYQPLGEVFGVPEKQIQDLAANVIVKEWGVKEDSNGYNNDPRVVIWNKSSHERETWHDHGRYPQTDNLDFYLSYHSMLVVAAKLIEKMPIIKKRDWYDDDWSEWLSRHLLSRKDGGWLADLKDPLPLKRPAWMLNKTDSADDWKSSITDTDFLSYLNYNEDADTWINVHGGWNEKQHERVETISISSALVSKKASDALLNALVTCSDPHDYKLPYYGERGMGIDSGIFKLTGWVEEPSGSKGIDEFDPYADQIHYPRCAIGDTISERLGITLDADTKRWFNNSKEVVAICESWSSGRGERDENPDQTGTRLTAELPFLKYLCDSFDCELIFKVSIRREIKHSYRSGSYDYDKGRYKIFILSADGKLRTTNPD